MFNLFALAALLFPLYSHADIQLQTMKPTANVSVNGPDIPSDRCADLATELLEYQQDRADMDRRNVDTLFDVANVIGSWYNTLSPYEGRTVYISYGTFNNMYSSAITAGNNARFYEREYANLDQEFSALVDKANKCTEY